MANLAVVSTDVRIEVKALHANFWAASVKNIVKNKAFIDVGLRFSFPQNDARRIDFCVPCEVASSSDFSDLNIQVMAEGTRDLIFGVDTSVSGNVIEYQRRGAQIEDEVIQIATFDVVNTKPKGDSHVAINFPSPLRPGRTYYLRFRYVPKDLSSLIASKGWGDGRQGFLLDFRVNDIREAVVDSPFDETPVFVDVGEVNAFAILPASMNVVSSFPPFKHMRILESKAWKGYLQGHKENFESEKHTIHYWYKEDVRNDKPFRGFIHAHKEFGKSAMWLFFGLLGLSLISVVLGLLGLFSGNDAKSMDSKAEISSPVSNPSEEAPPEE